MGWSVLSVCLLCSFWFSSPHSSADRGPAVRPSSNCSSARFSCPPFLRSSICQIEDVDCSWNYMTLPWAWMCFSQNVLGKLLRWWLTCMLALARLSAVCPGGTVWPFLDPEGSLAEPLSPSCWCFCPRHTPRMRMSTPHLLWRAPLLIGHRHPRLQGSEKKVIICSP